MSVLMGKFMEIGSLGKTGFRALGLLTALLFVCATGVSTTAAEEEETLVKGELDHNGFIAAIWKTAHIVGETELMLGIRGGWIIDHTVILGIGCYGLTGESKTRKIESKEEKVEYSYGGLELEYVHNSSKIIHPSIYLLIGSGHVRYEDENLHFDDRGEIDEFFIAEPGTNLMFNITKFLRAGIGASYRFVSDVEQRGLHNSDLDGFSATLTLKFGKF
jgi:hypothetical protein